MGYLIKHYDIWSGRFYSVLKYIMEITFDTSNLKKSNVDEPGISDEEFCFAGLQSPFIFIRYLTSFFLDDEEEDLVAERHLSQVERDRILDIGEKLGFTEIPLFNKFVTKLKVR
jgi:hypothetical protein